MSWKKVDILEISGGTYSSPGKSEHRLRHRNPKNGSVDAVCFVAFAAPETVSTPGSRQSLFAHFTTALLPHLPHPPEGPAIILTGGMHDRPIIGSSLRDRACDLVGIGRPACIRPDLPNAVILNRDVPQGETTLGGYGIPGSDLVKWIFGGGRRRTGETANGIVGDGKKSQEGIPLVGAGISTLWHEWQLCRIGRGLEPDLGMNWICGGVMVELIWWGLLRGGPLAWLGLL